MRWLVMAVAVAACERSQPTPAPVPDDARILDAQPACNRSTEPARLKALDDLAGYVRTAKRERSVVEAPLELTSAYIELELAYAYARQGRDARALELRGIAHRTLDQPAKTDGVHAYLLGVYDTRIDQAMHCLPLGAPLPRELEVQLAGFGRVDRYKVDRLREASSTLTLDHVDGIGAFSRGADAPRTLDAIRRLPAEADRARALTTFVDGLAASGGAASGGAASGGAASGGNGRDRHADEDLEAAIDALGDLSPAVARPVLVTIQRTIGFPSEPVTKAKPDERDRWSDQFRLAGELLAAVVRIDPPVARSLVRVLAEAIGGDPETLDLVLVGAVRGLRGEPALLKTLLGAAKPEAVKGVIRPQAFGIARALMVTGDVATARPLIADHLAYIAAVDNGHLQRDAIREVARVYALAPADVALPGLEALRVHFAVATDSFSTNSHYCLSAIKVVSALALAIVGE